MIRVLHVIGAMDRGGAETMIMNLYRAIDRDAIQFDFMVHEENACDYDEEIRELGGALYRVPRFTGLNGLSYRRSFRAFFAEHDEHAVVHGHIGSCAALYLSEANRAGRYTIAHSHAQNYPISPAQLAFRVISYPTRFIADYYMACSFEAGCDRFGKTVAHGSCFRVLKNGIDLEQYRCDEKVHESCKEKYGYNVSTPLVGHVGRFDQVKNHKFLLEVFSLVKAEVPEARLICVGRGPLVDQMKRQACDLGMSDSVDFFGVREDVNDLLRSFDSFVFPSFKEGLAIAVIEAQSSGVPVLASTGVPEGAMLVEDAVRLPLSDGPAKWASKCIDSLLSVEVRRDNVDLVRERGYDIVDTARWLEQFYLSRARTEG